VDTTIQVIHLSMPVTKESATYIYFYKILYCFMTDFYCKKKRRTMSPIPMDINIEVTFLLMIYIKSINSRVSCSVKRCHQKNRMQVLNVRAM